MSKRDNSIYLSEELKKFRQSRDANRYVWRERSGEIENSQVGTAASDDSMALAMRLLEKRKGTVKQLDAHRIELVLEDEDELTKEAEDDDNFQSVMTTIISNEESKMMGKTTTTEEGVEITEDVRQMREKVRKRYRSKLANIAMREALVSDDRMQTYTDVMSEDGYIPIFIPIISIAELAVFIYYCIDYGEVGLTTPVPVDSPLIFSPYKHEQIWRFLSYLLIHAGLEHIIANLLFQLVVGILLEIVHGPIRMFIIYFAGVIAGSLATAVIDPNVYLCGASAGVYALLAAYLANIVMNWSEMNWLFRTIRLVLLFIYAVLDIGSALYRRYGEQESSATAYMAHVFGAIAGFLIGIVILRNIKKKLHEQVLFWIALCVYIIMDVLLLCVYIGFELRDN